MIFAAALALTAPAFAGTDSTTAVDRPTRVAGDGSNQAGFLQAGPSGAEWKFPGGARLRARAGTKLRVMSTPQSLVLAGGRRANGYTVIVRAGHVDLNFPTSAPSSSAVILALPGRFTAIAQSGVVHAMAEGRVAALGVVDGLTTASIGGGTFHAVARGSIIESNGRAARVREMIAAPERLQGGGVWVTVAGRGSEPTRRELAWEAVPNAHGYRVELSRKGEAEPVTRLETKESNLSASFGVVPTGDYELRVYALDALGFASAKPLSAPLRVVQAQIPPGGYVDRGQVIRLPARQRLHVSSIDGVEMTYGNDGRYFRARRHGDVGLMGGAATRVHFRIPGTYEISTIKLAPRTVRARVVVGPKTVTWPARSVEIRIQLVDETGEPIPEWIEMVPRVTLGIEELDVRFRRVGRTLSALVDPQPGPGPWVVRVEVADQFGLPLGRDFVEVIRTPNRRGAAQAVAAQPAERATGYVSAK